MNYDDSEVRKKAAEWQIPYQAPRTLAGKVSIFKAAPTLSLTGIIMLATTLFLFVFFYFLGAYTDIFVSEWKQAWAEPLQWTTTNERVNNHYVAAIIIKFTADDGKEYQTKVKITNFSRENEYRIKLKNREMIEIEYDADNPKTARIKGMKSTAMPGFFMFFPFIFLVVGLGLTLGAKKKAATARFVLENGKFAVGKIISETIKRTKNNKQLILEYEFKDDENENIIETYTTSPRRKGEFEQGQEIPVLYYDNGTSVKSHSPVFLKVQFADY